MINENEILIQLWKERWWRSYFWQSNNKKGEVIAQAKLGFMLREWEKYKMWKKSLVWEVVQVVKRTWQKGIGSQKIKQVLNCESIGFKEWVVLKIIQRLYLKIKSRKILEKNKRRILVIVGKFLVYKGSRDLRRLVWAKNRLNYIRLRRFIFKKQWKKNKYLRKVSNKKTKQVIPVVKFFGKDKSLRFWGINSRKGVVSSKSVNHWNFLKRVRKMDSFFRHVTEVNMHDLRVFRTRSRKLYKRSFTIFLKWIHRKKIDSHNSMPVSESAIKYGETIWGYWRTKKEKWGVDNLGKKVAGKEKIFFLNKRRLLKNERYKKYRYSGFSINFNVSWKIKRGGKRKPVCRNRKPVWTMLHSPYQEQWKTYWKHGKRRIFLNVAWIKNIKLNKDGGRQKSHQSKRGLRGQRSKKLKMKTNLDAYDKKRRKVGAGLSSSLVGMKESTKDKRHGSKKLRVVKNQGSEEKNKESRAERVKNQSQKKGRVIAKLKNSGDAKKEGFTFSFSDDSKKSLSSKIGKKKKRGSRRVGPLFGMRESRYQPWNEDELWDYKKGKFGRIWRGWNDFIGFGRQGVNPNRWKGYYNKITGGGYHYNEMFYRNKFIIWEDGKNIVHWNRKNGLMGRNKCFNKKKNHRAGANNVRFNSGFNYGVGEKKNYGGGSGWKYDAGNEKFKKKTNANLQFGDKFLQNSDYQKDNKSWNRKQKFESNDGRDSGFNAEFRKNFSEKMLALSKEMGVNVQSNENSWKNNYKKLDKSWNTKKNFQFDDKRGKGFSNKRFNKNWKKNISDGYSNDGNVEVNKKINVNLQSNINSENSGYSKFNKSWGENKSFKFGDNRRGKDFSNKRFNKNWKKNISDGYSNDGNAEVNKKINANSQFNTNFENSGYSKFNKSWSENKSFQFDYNRRGFDKQKSFDRGKINRDSSNYQIFKKNLNWDEKKRKSGFRFNKYNKNYYGNRGKNWKIGNFRKKYGVFNNRKKGYNMRYRWFKGKKIWGNRYKWKKRRSRFRSKINSAMFWDLRRFRGLRQRWLHLFFFQKVLKIRISKRKFVKVTRWSKKRWRPWWRRWRRVLNLRRWRVRKIWKKRRRWRLFGGVVYHFDNKRLIIKKRRRYKKRRWKRLARRKRLWIKRKAYKQWRYHDKRYSGGLSVAGSLKRYKKLEKYNKDFWRLRLNLFNSINFEALNTSVGLLTRGLEDSDILMQLPSLDSNRKLFRRYFKALYYHNEKKFKVSRAFKKDYKAFKSWLHKPRLGDLYSTSFYGLNSKEYIWRDFGEIKKKRVSSNIFKFFNKFSKLRELFKICNKGSWKRIKWDYRCILKNGIKRGSIRRIYKRVLYFLRKKNKKHYWKKINKKMVWRGFYNYYNKLQKLFFICLKRKYDDRYKKYFFLRRISWAADAGQGLFFERRKNLFATTRAAWISGGRKKIQCQKFFYFYKRIIRSYYKNKKKIHLSKSVALNRVADWIKTYKEFSGTPSKFVKRSSRRLGVRWRVRVYHHWKFKRKSEEAQIKPDIIKMKYTITKLFAWLYDSDNIKWIISKPLQNYIFSNYLQNNKIVYNKKIKKFTKLFDTNVFLV